MLSEIIQLEKHPLSFCIISETLPECQQKDYISGMFWALKAN